MGFELIITEKPKQAFRIAKALADDSPHVKRYSGASYYEATIGSKRVVVAPAVGHLFGLKESSKGWEYPVFDVTWVPIYEIDKNAAFTKKYIMLLRSLVKDADSFTVACDYDVEGELIGWNVLRFILGKENSSRMKFSTLTRGDLREAYAKKSKSINLSQAVAGETRHVLDWYYGINVSRALTTALKLLGTFRILSSGRVQGPALKLIVDRERTIQSFVVKPFWRVSYIGKLNGGLIKGYHADERFWEKSEAERVFDKCKNKDGTVDTFETHIKVQYPPIPFDLTTLQVEASRWLRISPQATLNYAQSLYISGYISYPRTSSQKLPPQLGHRRILQAISANPAYKGLVGGLLSKPKLWPRQGKKEDPAHPAIYPTGNLPKGLTKPQASVYDLIVKRYLACFGDPAQREHVRLSLAVEGEPFIAEGALTIEPGWHTLYKPYLKLNEVKLPKAKPGDRVLYKDIKLEEDATKPPSRYTQASLVKELSERNLGTKATRGMIVATLFKRGYVTGKPIKATKLGMQIISILEKRVPEIIDEELTRSFEEDMDKIRENKLKQEEVLKRARDVLSRVLNEFKTKEKEIGKELNQANNESNQDLAIAQCPVCKQGLLIVKHSKNNKRFLACNRYPECKATFPLPQVGKIYKTGQSCNTCGYPIIKVFNPGIKRTIAQCINPNCPTNKSEHEGMPCPKCKQGKLVVRTSRYGRFLACNRYPKCKYTERIQPKVK